MSGRPVLMHVTTTDMSLDWLLGPQLSAFAAAGYEVVGVSAPGPHVAALDAAGIRHIAVRSLTRSSDPFADLRALRDLYRVFRSERPTIVHTHNPKPGVLGRVAARLARVPVIVNTQHGLWAQPADRARRRLPVYAIERVAAMCSHAELVQNPEDADTLVRTLHVPARRVQVLGNGIDLDRFDPTVVGDARSRLRREWNLPDDAVVCGVVGRLVWEKGIREVLGAAAQLRTTHPAARFVVIGPTETDKPDALREVDVAAAEAAGVRFVGTRHDMPECYAALDLFVTGTYREGFPRAAMEASAMGLPVIATDVRGCRQVVRHGITGTLVQPRSAAALATALAELVGDPERRVRMGAAGRALALVEFDQQRVIERTLHTYNDLLAG